MGAAIGKIVGQVVKDAVKKAVKEGVKSAMKNAAKTGSPKDEEQKCSSRASAGMEKIAAKAVNVVADVLEKGLKSGGPKGP